MYTPIPQQLTVLIAAFIQIPLFLLFPGAAILFNKKVPKLTWLSPVVLCYLFGILLPNVLRFPVVAPVSMTMTELTVLLSIPMLLFSVDFVRWLRLAGSTLLSFSLACLSVMIVAAISSFVFARYLDEAPQIAGMMVGVYTGGTPNMNAIGLALNVRTETYILLNASDFLLGAVYYFFLLTIGTPLLGKVFRPFGKTDGGEASAEKRSEEWVPVKTIPMMFVAGTGALLLGAAIAAAAAGIALLLTGSLNAGIIILTATALGIAASFVPRLRRLESAYRIGQYILLIFCVAIGSLARPADIVASGGTIFVYTAVVMFGSILLHFTVARLFDLDRDTVIVTSTAAIYGPAFIPPVVELIDNRQLLVSGLTTGLVGLAVGNFLGYGLARLLGA